MVMSYFLPIFKKGKLILAVSMLSFFTDSLFATKRAADHELLTASSQKRGSGSTLLTHCSLGEKTAPEHCPIAASSVIENLGYFLASSASQASPLVKRLAETWVRNASEYIFSNDLRSFLELVVNACDTTVEAAGHPELAVGKFGMGFFSIFSLLRYKNMSNVRIILTTTYKKNDQLCSYQLVFKPKESFDVSIEHHTIAPQEKTGTTIEITTDTPLSDQELQQLYEYTCYLDFYEQVKIKLCLTKPTVLELSREELLGNREAQHEITVMLSPTYLKVQDSGTGISEDTVTTSLLIPSSSTKGKADLNALREMSLKKPASLPRFGLWKGKADKQNSYFIITVNGVIVIKKKVQAPFMIPGLEGDLSNNAQDLILALPQATQLTIARDELSISVNGKSFEETIIKKIIEQTIDFVFADPSQVSLLSAFYRSLEAWEEQTAAHHIKGLFTGYLKQEVTKKLKITRNIPAPEAHYKVLGKLLKTDKLIPLPADLVNYDYSLASDLVLKVSKEKIAEEQVSSTRTLQEIALAGQVIAGRHLIFVPDELLGRTAGGQSIISNIGLSFALFVPYTFLSQAQEHAVTLEEQKSFLASKIITVYSEDLISTPRYSLSKSMQIIKVNDNCSHDQLMPDEINKRLNEINEKIAQLCKTIKPLVTQELYAEIPASNPLKYAIEHKQELPELLALAKRWTPLLFLQEEMPAHRTFEQLLVLLLALHGINKEKAKQQLWYLCAEHPELSPEQLQDLRASRPYEDYKMKEHKARLLADYQRNDKLYRFSFEDNTVTALWPLSSLPTGAEIDLLAQSLYNNCPTQIKKQTNGEYTGDSMAKDASYLGSRYAENILTNKSWLLQRDAFCSDLFEYHRFFLSYYPINKTWDERCYLHTHDHAHYTKVPASQELLKKIIQFSNYYDEQLRHLMVPFSAYVSTDPFIFLLNSMESDNARLPNDFAEKIHTFITTLLGLYGRYYTISEHDLAHEYGKKTVYRLSTDFRGDFKTGPSSHRKEMYLLLKLIAEKDRQLFDRLLSYTLEEQAARVDIQQRNHLLSTKKSFIPPDLFEQTSIGLWGERYWSARCNRDQEIMLPLINVLLEQCLKSCMNSQEFMIASTVLSSKDIVNIMVAYNEQTKNYELVHELSFIQQAIHNFITHFVREKMSNGSSFYATLEKDIKGGRSLSSAAYSLMNRGYGEHPLVKEIVDYFDALFKGKELFTEAEPLLIGQKNNQAAFLDCSLSQLLKLHCTGEGIVQELQKHELASVHERAAKEQPGYLTKKIEQAVNAGSERSALQSVTTEAVQNSIDAVREFVSQATPVQQAALAYRQELLDYDATELLTKTTKINLSLGFIMDKNKPTHSQATVSITDCVGMNLVTLLTNFLIPDYSTKSPLAGATGVMGNGAFQLYKEADRVEIITRSLDNPKKVYYLVVTPLRNAYNLVHDLHIHCLDISNNNEYETFFGTRMRVVFQSSLHEEKTVFDLLAARAHLANSIGAIKATVVLGKDKKSIDLFYSSKKSFELDSFSELLNPQPSLTDYVALDTVREDAPIECYRRSHRNYESYVLTNGLPLVPLAQFAQEMHLLPADFINVIETGFILNIPAQLYHPVQSRTHIKIDEKTVQQLRKMLLDAVYMSQVRQHASLNNDEFRAELGHRFTHFASSCSDLKQLKLSYAVHKKTSAAIDEFIQSGKSDTILSLEHFFTSHRPVTTKMLNHTSQSFYEYISDAMNHWSPLLSQLEDETRKSINNLIEEHKQKLIGETGDWRKQVMLAVLKSSVENLLKKANEKIDQQLSAWKSSPLLSGAGSRELIQNVIIPWIENKVSRWVAQNESLLFNEDNLFRSMPTFRTESMRKQEEARAPLREKLLSVKKVIQKTLQALLTTYHASLESSYAVKNIIWSTDMDNSTLGVFDQLSRVITMNLRALPSMTNLIKLILHNLYEGKLDGIHMNPLFNQLFGTNQVGSIGCLIHELEHARRNDTHDHDNAHGPAVDAAGNQASFDACAKSYAVKMIQDGFIERWIKTLRAAIDPQEVKLLSDHLDLISQLELSDKTGLLDLCKS